MNATATFTAQDGTTTTRKYAHGWTAGNAARKAIAERRAVKVHYIDHVRGIHNELVLRYGKVFHRQWREDHPTPAIPTYQSDRLGAVTIPED